MERADWAIQEAEGEVVGAHRRVAREVTRAFYKVALAQVAVTVAQESKAAVDRLVDTCGHVSRKAPAPKPN